MDGKKLRTLLPTVLIAMSACGGIASVSLNFSGAFPANDGSGNIALRVTEGIGTAEMVIEEHVEPFDPDFDVAKIRVPFGTSRTLIATIETDEAQPRTVFGGRTATFSLEESDNPNLRIDMVPVPGPGTMSVMGATDGRVGSATITLSIAGSGFTLSVPSVEFSEDPTFPRDDSVTINPIDPRLTITLVSPLMMTVRLGIDDRCAVRSGCERTIYARFVDPSGFASPAFSASLIYDPYPPQLIDAAVRIDQGAVLGTDGTAVVDLEFDEPVGYSVYAVLASGSPACPARVEATDDVFTGFDFDPNCAGTYAIEVNAVDLAANTARIFDAATLVVDRLPPAPIELSVVTSTCVAEHSVIVGGPGAADARATIDASGSRARADASGAFVVSAEPGMVGLVQLDPAGNASAPQTFEVVSCGS